MEISSSITRSILVKSNDPSEIGNARRQALALGTSLDFSELRCGQVGIVVTEAARNLSTHGGGGEILLTGWRHGAVSGIDVLALDKGAGIADLSTAMQDGYSTGGTHQKGSGLGLWLTATIVHEHSGRVAGAQQHGGRPLRYLRFGSSAVTSLRIASPVGSGQHE